MITQNIPIFEMVLESLKSKVNEIERNSVEFVFSKWIRGASNEINEDLKIVANTSGGTRSYREVAKLGYGANLGIETPEFKSSLNENLKWIFGRPAFSPNSTPNFEIHGVALLGITLGFLSSEHDLKEEGKAWLASFIHKSSSSKISSFNYSLIALSAHLIDQGSLVPFRSDPYSIAAKDLHEELSNKKIKTLDIQSAFKKLDLTYLDGDGAESALKLYHLEAAMKNLASIDFKSLKETDVFHVLKTIPHSLKLWTWESTSRTGRQGAQPIKWEIENEYHFQNLLWTILSPVIPDLEDEEPLKSVGPKRPRADLCIPSLKMVIEAKYMRSFTQSQQAQIIEEIAADASLYCSPGSGYTQVVPVIWDNTRSSEFYAEIIQGLENIPNVSKAFIISRPGKMII